MIRNVYLGLITTVAILTTGCAVATEENQAEKPNILLIFIDDAGYSDFGFSGAKNFETPNITALAESGVIFEQGYVTAAVCSPSRAGLLTGRYQTRFGHEMNIPAKQDRHPTPEILGLPLSEITIADLLKEQGYYTGVLGKWHLGEQDHFHPNERGFDEFYGLLSGSRSYFPEKGLPHNKIMLRGNKHERFEGYLTDVLGEEAEQFIERNSERPFFLYLSYTAVHGPMHATEEKLARYADIENKGRRAMAGMADSLDDSVGGVLDKLEQLGIADNTIVFFVNDNGGSSKNHSVNRPLRGYKGSAWEGGLRVPYTMRWPGNLPEGVRYEPAVSTLDILPTVLAAAGANLPDDREYDGVNLLPYLSAKGLANKDEVPHDELYWRRGAKATAREGDLKYIRNDRSGNELYDLSTDPYERKNLLEIRPDDAARLKAKLEAWESQMVDKLWGDRDSENNSTKRSKKKKRK